MKPFRIRLTFILMALVGVSMIGAGLTMAKLFKDSHISALEENMSREIMLLSGTFQFIDMNSQEAMSYYTEHAKHIAGLTSSRITFITKEGKVIGDSERNPLEMDNHSNREEEILAAKEGIGRAIRFSDTLDRDMLYVAGAVTSADGFDGYIRLSMGLDAVTEGLSRAWIIMAAGLVLLFIAATFVSYKVASSMTSPLEQITRVARRITDLDYDARVPMQRKDEVGQLAKAINAMADSLQAQLKTIRDNEDLLQSVLDNMTGGIVMVNAEGNLP